FGDWPYVRTHIVYNTKVKKDYIQIDAIIGHGATWKLPKGCFGIKRNALVVVDLSKKVSNSLALLRHYSLVSSRSTLSLAPGSPLRDS
uniref:hypothetical protein n=1 Tax=Salmonella sp. s60732 TaxID=3160132 RepID=UPI003753FD08